MTCKCARTFIQRGDHKDALHNKLIVLGTTDRISFFLSFSWNLWMNIENVICCSVVLWSFLCTYTNRTNAGKLMATNWQSANGKKYVQYELRIFAFFFVIIFIYYQHTSILHIAWYSFKCNYIDRVLTVWQIICCITSLIHVLLFNAFFRMS